MLALYRLVSRLIPYKAPELPEGKFLWFHGASLGEHKALQPLVRRFRERGFVPFLTATAPSALGFAEPFSDNPRFVRRVLRRASAVVVAEAELWPNLIFGARESGVPIFLVNARVGPGTRRWSKFFPGALRKLYSNFTRIFPRGEAEAAELLKLGVPEGVLGPAGDLKLDAVERAEPLSPEELGLDPGLPVLVLGSLRPGEFEAAAKVAEALAGKAQVVLAPRHLEALPELLRLLKVPYSLRSEGGGGPVLVLDTYGELGRVWGLARAAFVGGSLAPFGGHNLLEPALWGVPVAFGPHFENQREAAEGLLEAGGGFLVKGAEELVSLFEKILSNEELWARASEAARVFAERRRGAAERVFQEILKYL